MKILIEKRDTLLNYYELCNKDIKDHKYIYTTFREVKKACINEYLFKGLKYNIYDEYFNTIIKFEDIISFAEDIELPKEYVEDSYE